MSQPERWLIGLDIDGTLVHDDGFLSTRVVEQVQRVRSLGHEVVIATGRAAANAYPVIKDLNVSMRHAVCSNGAVTIRLDSEHPRGFAVHDVKTFEPAEVLTQLIDHLPNAHFAVEDVDGSYRFHKPFPAYALGDVNHEAPLEELMHKPVSRVVVLSPDHDVEEFLGPQGIDKGHGLEQLRQHYDIPGRRTLVMGDGRNDIEMFRWARGLGGHAFAMGQAPDEVKLEATAVTAAVDQDGVAQVLEALEGLEFLQ
ncbi:MAG: hypothetical protein RL418_758 [Actinomycetota bacterium]